MKNASAVCAWIVEISLMGIVGLTTLSHTSVPIRHVAIFLLVGLGLLVILLLGKAYLLCSTSGRTVIALILMFAFGSASQFRWFGTFGIARGGHVTMSIQPAVVLMFVAVIAWLVKVGVGKENIQFPETSFGTSFLCASLLIGLCMLVLYPPLRIMYQMDAEPDLSLLRQIIQYLFLFFLTANRVLSRPQVVRLAWTIVVSFGATVGLRGVA